MSNPTIPSLLYPGYPRIVMHTELSINSAEQPRPVDQTRSPGYDLHVLTDVQALLSRAAALGITDIMPNTYGLEANGQPTPEQVALELFFEALPSTSLGLMINIDKGLYSTKPSPIAAIQAYLLYLREKAFPLKNYQRYNGEYVVTYFCVPTDSPEMFAQIEAENTDIRFVYNDFGIAAQVATLTGSKGKGENTMGWIVEGLDAALDSYCSFVASRPQSELHIPYFSPGFNDTIMREGQATSVWQPPVVPARVWGPPSLTVAQKFFAVLNKYYGPGVHGDPLSGYKPTWIQGITLNDHDEDTNMETPANGPNPYFSNIPPPVVVTHGEVWDGPNKLGNISLGSHIITLQQVNGDGSVVAATKKEISFDV